MSAQGNFVTVLGCMDGRCQAKTVIFAKKLFKAQHVDTITEPGMDKVLAGGAHAVADKEFLPHLRKWIKRKALISAKGHGSKHVLITGHMSCAGNPVSYEEHIAHLTAAKKSVGKWKLFEKIHVAVFDEKWMLKALM